MSTQREEREELLGHMELFHSEYNKTQTKLKVLRALRKAAIEDALRSGWISVHEVAYRLGITEPSVFNIVNRPLSGRSPGRPKGSKNKKNEPGTGRHHFNREKGGRRREKGGGGGDVYCRTFSPCFCPTVNTRLPGHFYSSNTPYR